MSNIKCSYYSNLTADLVSFFGSYNNRSYYEQYFSKIDKSSWVSDNYRLICTIDHYNRYGVHSWSATISFEYKSFDDDIVNLGRKERDRKESIRKKKALKNF